MFSQSQTVRVVALEVLLVILSAVLSKKNDEDSKSQAKENQELTFLRILQETRNELCVMMQKLNQIKMQFTILMKSQQKVADWEWNNPKSKKKN